MELPPSFSVKSEGELNLSRIFQQDFVILIGFSEGLGWAHTAEERQKHLFKGILMLLSFRRIQALSPLKQDVLSLCRVHWAG